MRNFCYHIGNLVPALLGRRPPHAADTILRRVREPLAQHVASHHLCASVVPSLVQREMEPQIEVAPFRWTVCGLAGYASAINFFISAS
jgi:hypothetical protein